MIILFIKTWIACYFIKKTYDKNNLFYFIFSWSKPNNEHFGKINKEINEERISDIISYDNI